MSSRLFSVINTRHFPRWQRPQLHVPGPYHASLPAGRQSRVVDRQVGAEATWSDRLTSTLTPPAQQLLAGPRRELGGPPPGIPRQVRAITVQIEQLDDGQWRFLQLKVNGWVATARRPGEVVAAIRQAFVEAQISAYSLWRGHLYDLEEVDPAFRRHKPRSRGRKRCDVYDPREWRLRRDGTWIAPGKGHRYPEHSQCVQRVMAARQRLGLTARPDPANPDPLPAELQPATKHPSL